MPIGLVQQASAQEAQQNLMYGEIGSAIKRRAKGDTQYSGTLSRVFTTHSDLKYACYKWMKSFLNGEQIRLLRRPAPKGSAHFVGLESDLYQIPFGLVVVYGNARGEFLKAEFWEKCEFINVGKSIQVQNVMLIDNAAISVLRKVPIMDNKSGVSLFPVIGSEDGPVKIEDLIDREAIFEFPQPGLQTVNGIGKSVDVVGTPSDK